MSYNPHTQYLATHKDKLEQHITDVTIPKSEAEWWAQKEIECLRHRIAELEAALKPFAEITAQQNFKDYQYNQDDCVMTAGVWGFKPDFTFKLGDFRAARNVLGKNQ